MKKFLLFLLIVGFLWFFFFFKDSRTTDVENNFVADTDFQPDPSSATFSFDERSVTLSNGKSEGDGELVELLEQQTSGDLNADNKEDTVVLLSNSGGGSGIFIYIAAFVSGPINYKGTNTIFVGDRISPESLSINNGVVTFKYLDRKPDEAFAAEPTVPKTIQYIYKNGEFQER